MSERLQKVLARHGLGSRREIERWIAEGRVTVNREPVKVGAQYRTGDRVAIDGKEVTARLAIEVAPRGLMFHKSHGQSIGHDDRTQRPPDDADFETAPPDAEGSVTAVVDQLPALRGSRWVPINPMHGGDSGLLLFTTDGTLGYALTRRKRWIPTGYMVRVLAPGNEVHPEIPPHVAYDDEQVEFTKVEPAGGEGSNLWFKVELGRADHRAAVRALFESRELKVSRMIQVAFGELQLPRDLPRGRHRELTVEQMEQLYTMARIAAPAALRGPKVVKSPATRAGKRPAPDRRRAAKPKRTSAGSRSRRTKND
jgi:23S rRNA pseudouridine2605 synthase